ncbi:MAG: hypothetical protein ACW99U_11220 [Candidatus Thorarchaeota archaeon]
MKSVTSVIASSLLSKEEEVFDILVCPSDRFSSGAKIRILIHEMIHSHLESGSSAVPRNEKISLQME